MKVKLIFVLCFVPIPTWQASFGILHSFVWYALGSLPGQQTEDSGT
jgi:hypothetical protein